MIKHGGVYHHYYSTAETNYVIASNLPDTKVKQLNGLKVVKPEWIVDSIKAGKRLDYADYLLYTNRSVRQQALEFKSKQLDKDLTVPTANSNVHEKHSKNQYTARTASDERFLSEFYNNSRLHLISTMGAMFKQYINELRSNEKHEFPGRALLNSIIEATPSTSTRYYVYNKQNEVIMHIDMDCFFVSVGLKKYPTYRGLPVAVTHAKGNKSNAQEGSNRKYEMVMYQQKLAEKYKDNNSSDFRSKLSEVNDTDSMSEIASCSYEARKAGIKNGMFLGQALKLCPGLKTIPYDFEGYKEVSLILYNTIAR
jgi:DNA repair protein REV1